MSGRAKWAESSEVVDLRNSLCVSSYSQCASQQFELLDQLPSLFLDELLSYSSTLSSFYQLKDKFVPVTTSTTHCTFFHFLHPHLSTFSLSTSSGSGVTAEVPLIVY